MNISLFHPLPRRTFLKGIGTCLSLPLLEAMLPRHARGVEPPAVIPRRMGIFYFGTGMNMDEFTPRDDGPEFTFSRILKPLEAHRRDFTLLSGTWLRHGGSHMGDYTFLTGVKAHTPQGIKNSISADQLAATSRDVGQGTRFPSLQLSVERGTGFGGPLCTLSWNARGVPLPAESDPAVLFGRLFGKDLRVAGGSESDSLKQRGSILDALLSQARRLERRIGAADRIRIDEYLTSVREVERQLQRDIEWSGRPKPEPGDEAARAYSRSYSPERTRDFHYGTYAKLMYDLIALAFQTDSTRVVTYVVRKELNGGVYPEFGVSKGYHDLSHHNNDPRNLEELARVDTIYMQHWAAFLSRMKTIREVDGSSLLDHSLLAFSSGMGMNHSPDRLPTVICGGRATGLVHRGHIRLKEKTPLSAVWHTMLHRIGVATGPQFQDSPGLLKDLSA